MKELYYKFLHAYSGSYTRKILLESIDLLEKLWPYLVIGIILTTLIKLYISKQKLADFFISRGHVSIILASFIGIISPLGSYIIIPLSAGLFAVGVPLPVLMALLMSSPLINPNLFLLTSGAFGIELAIVRTISAFILGVTAGYITMLLIQRNWIVTKNILKENKGWDFIEYENEKPKPKWSVFWFELYKMTKYICKYFFIAIILAALIKIMVSPNYIIRLFNGNLFLSVLLTTGAGIPFYVCGGAAIPVIQQLAELGMSKGAVLAFFISGPVTKISNLVLMNAAFKFRVFLVYILVGIIGAFVLGVVYNII